MITSHDPDYIFDVTRVGQRMYNACNEEVWLAIATLGAIGGAISGAISTVNIVENGLNEAGSIAGGITLIIAGLIARGFLHSSTSRKDDLKELSNAYLSMGKADRKKYRKQMHAAHLEAKRSGDTYYYNSVWKMPLDEMVDLFQLKAVEMPNSADSMAVQIKEDLEQARADQKRREELERDAQEIRRKAELEVAKLMGEISG